MTNLPASAKRSPQPRLRVTFCALLALLFGFWLFVGHPVKPLAQGVTVDTEQSQASTEGDSHSPDKGLIRLPPLYAGPSPHRPVWLSLRRADFAAHTLRPIRAPPLPTG